MTQIWQLIFSDSCGDLWNQVRDFEFDPEGQMQRSEELDRLQHDQEILQSTLLQWCYASYGEVPISI
jgi:V-type H+-transporting ATPase subunit C